MESKSPFVQLMAELWCDSNICWSSMVVLFLLPADNAIFCWISAWKSGTDPFNIESMPFEPFLRPLVFGVFCCCGVVGIGCGGCWTWCVIGTVEACVTELLWFTRLLLLLLGITKGCLIGDDFFMSFLRLWLLFSSISLAFVSSFRLPSSFDTSWFPFWYGICCEIGEVIGIIELGWDFGKRFVKLVGPFTVLNWLIGGDCECCVMNCVSDEPWDIFCGELGCDVWVAVVAANRSFHFLKRFLMRLASVWSLPLFCLKAWRSLIIRVFCMKI